MAITDVDADMADARLVPRGEGQEIPWAKERRIAIHGNSDGCLRTRGAGNDHGKAGHHILNETAAVEASLWRRATVAVASANLRPCERDDRIS
jgi:hypothetical protein